MPLKFCTPEVEEFTRGKGEKWGNSLGVRVKIVEFFRGKKTEEVFRGKTHIFLGIP